MYAEVDSHFFCFVYIMLQRVAFAPCGQGVVENRDDSNVIKECQNDSVRVCDSAAAHEQDVDTIIVIIIVSTIKEGLSWND